MKQHHPSFFSDIKTSFSDWQKDKVPMLGAAFSYYSVFAIAPLLTVIISILGLVFGAKAARGQIEGQLQGFLGKNGAETIQSILAHADDHSTGVISLVISFLLLLLGASGVFGQLKDTLNLIWEVSPRPGMGIIEFIRTRFLSFAMVLVICFLVVISLVASSAVTAVNTYLGFLIPVKGLFLAIIDIVVSMGILSVLFGLIYKVLPDAEIPWSVSFRGGILAAILFTVAKELIAFYIGFSSPGSTYGAAGSLIVILLWIYYTSQIVFLGAEYTKVYATSHRIKISPSKYGVMEDSQKPEAVRATKQRVIATFLGYFTSGLIKGVSKEIKMDKKKKKRK